MNRPRSVFGWASRARSPRLAHPVNEFGTSRGFRSPGRALLVAFLAVAGSFLAATAYSQYRARVIDIAALTISEGTSPSIEKLADVERHVEADGPREGAAVLDAIEDDAKSSQVAATDIEEA